MSRLNDDKFHEKLLIRAVLIEYFVGVPLFILAGIYFDWFEPLTNCTPNGCH